MPILTCQRCGGQFERATKRARYCYGECYRAAERDYTHTARQAWSPERRRASNLVWSAIWRGKLSQKPCEVCGKTRVDAHHDDYSKPLDVRWLCRSHHRQLHADEHRARRAVA